MKPKPDVHEAITDRQLVEAVATWLDSKGRLPKGMLYDTLLTTTDTGTHVFKAWLKETT